MRKTIDQLSMRHNILEVYEQATADERAKGLEWYDNAHLITLGLAAKSGVRHWKVCGIVAALSPQCEWYRNLTLTKRFLLGEREGLHATTQLKKADAIILASSIREVSDIVYGKKSYKTEAFYHNLLGESDWVTVDRHALVIAVRGEWKHLTRLRYRELTVAYSLLAGELGLEPSQLQATTWLTWRRMKGHMNT